MPDERIEVVSYSGYKSEESPRSFVFRGEKIEITEVVDMWIAEHVHDRTRKRFFIVKGNNGLIYKIFLNEKTREWFICKR